MVILNLSKSSCRFNFTKSVNFALFLLNLFFRAVSGLHKNEQKLQSFPVYLSAPQMRDLLHYQYPPTKWHICYSDEPTLKCQNHPEHIVYICLAYSMGFEKSLMKCNKLLNIPNRFIALKILCAPPSHLFLVTTHLRAFTIILFIPEYITIGITVYSLLIWLYMFSNIHLHFLHVFSFCFI